MNKIDDVLLEHCEDVQISIFLYPIRGLGGIILNTFLMCIQNLFYNENMVLLRLFSWYSTDITKAFSRFSGFYFKEEWALENICSF